MPVLIFIKCCVSGVISSFYNRHIHSNFSIAVSCLKEKSIQNMSFVGFVENLDESVCL